MSITTEEVKQLNSRTQHATFASVKEHLMDWSYLFVRMSWLPLLEFNVGKELDPRTLIISKQWNLGLYQSKNGLRELFEDNTGNSGLESQCNNGLRRNNDVR